MEIAARNLFCRLAILLLIGVGEAVMQPQAEAAAPWSVSGAKWRLRIERTKDSPWPAPVGIVEVSPANLDPSKLVATVCNAEGATVNSAIVWATNGEPVKIVFETSGAYRGSTHYVYLEETARSSSSWKPAGGMFLETRRLKRAAPPNNWEQCWKLWNESGPVLGYSPAKEIFHGHNPHDATTNFMALFSGWFTAPKPGEYTFAVVCTGPAFLRVDGKEVAERGVRATGGRGTRGQYSGNIKLTAGRHKLEYLSMHTMGEWIAEAAWKTPDARYLSAMPAKAFEQVASYEIAEFEPAPASGQKVYFTWEMSDHCIVDELALVEARFKAFPNDAGLQWRWKFDDGTTANGPAPLHLFARCGLRQVELEVLKQGEPLGRIMQLVRVRPQWQRLEEWSDKLYKAHISELLKRDYTRTPIADLVALVRLGDRLADHDLLSAVGAACLSRQDEFGPLEAEGLYLLGFHYEAPEVRDYDMAEKMWQAAIAHGLPSLKEKARLRLALYLIQVAGKPAEALQLLERINPVALTEAEARQLKLARGDAMLLQGKVAEAAKIYDAVGSLNSDLNRTLNIRTRARLEVARDFVRRGEWDRADEMLRQIEWETPADRLSVETGLARLQVYMGRKEYPRALTRCLQLLNVAIVDTHRADLLFYLSEIHRGMGRKEEAEAVLQKLVKEFPYSEAAAKARDKYGIVPPPPKKRGS